MQVLAEYHEKAVLDKHGVFTALNDNLAAVELMEEELEEVDSYDDKIHSKQDKLEINLKNCSRIV